MAEITKSFIKNGEKLRQLKHFLKWKTFIDQLIYPTLFPKYFCRTNNQAIQSSCKFEPTIATYKKAFSFNFQQQQQKKQQPIQKIKKIKDNDMNNPLIAVAGSNAMNATSKN